MNDRARSKQSSRALATSSLLASTGVLQRACACGQHTAGGGKCSACDKAGRLIQRSNRNPELETRNFDKAPITHEAVWSADRFLSGATHSFSEPNFNHDFSRTQAGGGTHLNDFRKEINHRSIATQSLEIPVATRLSSLASFSPQIQNDISKLGRGEGLSGRAKERLETQTGTSLDFVRIHRNPRARLLADSLGTRAFAIGRDIVLGSTAEQNGPPGNDRLLAHEVAHTIQQQPGRIDNATDPELEANLFADQATQERVSSQAAQPTQDRSAHKLRGAPRAPAGYNIDLPGNLMLVLTSHTHFIGACVRATVPHVGILLLRKYVPRPGNVIFDLHIGYFRDPEGRLCLFFYESHTGFCQTMCDRSRDVREWIREKLRELGEALGLPFWVIVTIAVVIAIIIFILSGIPVPVPV